MSDGVQIAREAAAQMRCRAATFHSARALGWKPDANDVALVFRPEP